MFLRILIGLVVVLVSRPAAAAEPKSVAVMELQFGGQADEAKARALEDLLSNEIRALGNLRVIGRSDVRGLLNLEKQKRLMGCTDEQCLAEIGGALGVDWMVMGTISDFGKTMLLNLKVLDVRGVRVAASSARKVSSQEQLVEALPAMVRELFGGLLGGIERAVSVEELEARRKRIAWGHGLFWSGVGLAGLGGVSLAMAKVKGDDWNSSGDPADRDASKAWEGVMWASFGLSAALLTAGVVFWSWQWEKGPREPGGEVAVFPVLGRGVIGLGGYW